MLPIRPCQRHVAVVGFEGKRKRKGDVEVNDEENGKEERGRERERARERGRERERKGGRESC